MRRSSRVGWCELSISRRAIAVVCRTLILPHDKSGPAMRSFVNIPRQLVIVTNKWIFHEGNLTWHRTMWAAGKSERCTTACREISTWAARSDMFCCNLNAFRPPDPLHGLGPWTPLGDCIPQAPDWALAPQSSTSYFTYAAVSHTAAKYATARPPDL